MAGERMSQHVRVQVLSQFAFARSLDPQLDRPRSQAPALLADKHRIVRRVGHGPQWQPLFQRLAGFFADWQQAGLAALAMHLDHAVRQVQLIEIEPGQLRQAQPGGVEQFENRLVPARQKVVFHATFQQLQGAVGVEGLRQAALAFGRCQAIGRIVVAEAFAVQVVIEPTYRRQQSRQAAGRLTL
ncbi:hypothetical protein D3C73_1238530 [compost metagenome]